MYAEDENVIIGSAFSSITQIRDPMSLLAPLLIPFATALSNTDKCWCSTSLHLNMQLAQQRLLTVLQSI